MTIVTNFLNLMPTPRRDLSKQLTFPSLFPAAIYRVISFISMLSPYLKRLDAPCKPTHIVLAVINSPTRITRLFSWKYRHRSNMVWNSMPLTHDYDMDIRGEENRFPLMILTLGVPDTDIYSMLPLRLLMSHPQQLVAIHRLADEGPCDWVLSGVWPGSLEPI